MRYQQIGPHGETIIDVHFSCEIVNDELFSITISPPDSVALNLMRSEHGVVDEKIANLSSYHKQNPPTWLFSLQHYDDIIQKIQSTKQQSQPQWTIQPIPESARTLLLRDLQHARLAAYAAPYASSQHSSQSDESDAAHLIASSLAPSPVLSSSSSSDETPKSQPRKTKKGSLLITKSAANRASEESKQHDETQSIVKQLKDKADAARHLTLEEETKLNPEKLPPHLRLVLLPFQMEGVEYLVSRGGRGLLADEMGK